MDPQSPTTSKSRENVPTRARYSRWLHAELVRGFLDWADELDAHADTIEDLLDGYNEEDHDFDPEDDPVDPDPGSVDGSDDCEEDFESLIAESKFTFVSVVVWGWYLEMFVM